MTNDVDLMERTRRLPQRAKHWEVGRNTWYRPGGYLWQTRVAQLVMTRMARREWLVRLRVKHIRDFLLSELDLEVWVGPQRSHAADLFDPDS